MISDLNRLVRDKEIDVLEPEFWKEAITYVRKPDGSTAAQPGCYDDRVMRVAIAATLLITDPYYEATAKVPLKEYTLDWYLQRAKSKSAPRKSGLMVV